jgi:hypothetical protein
MARSGTSNRGGNDRSRSRNNNPEGRNQYSGGILDTAKDRPFTAAATAAAAVGAGVFLWSKRNQISEQLTNLSTQISDWRDSMSSEEDSDFELAGSDSSSAIGSTSARTSRSQGSRPTATRGRSGSSDETGGGGI